MMDRERREAKEAIERATELLETKTRHVYFHIGQTMLTFAIRLFSEDNYKGACAITQAIFKLGWADDPPVRPVSGKVTMQVKQSWKEVY